MESPFLGSRKMALLKRLFSVLPYTLFSYGCILLLLVVVVVLVVAVVVVVVVVVVVK